MFSYRFEVFIGAQVFICAEVFIGSGMGSGYLYVRRISLLRRVTAIVDGGNIVGITNMLSQRND